MEKDVYSYYFDGAPARGMGITLDVILGIGRNNNRTVKYFLQFQGKLKYQTYTFARNLKTCGLFSVTSRREINNITYKNCVYSVFEGMKSDRFQGKYLTYTFARNIRPVDDTSPPEGACSARGQVLA